MHAYTPANSIFDGPITNLLSTLCILLDRNYFTCWCQGGKGLNEFKFGTFTDGFQSDGGVSMAVKRIIPRSGTPSLFALAAYGHVLWVMSAFLVLCFLNFGRPVLCCVCVCMYVCVCVCVCACVYGRKRPRRDMCMFICECISVCMCRTARLNLRWLWSVHTIPPGVCRIHLTTARTRRRSEVNEVSGYFCRVNESLYNICPWRCEASVRLWGWRCGVLHRVSFVFSVSGAGQAAAQHAAPGLQEQLADGGPQECPQLRGNHTVSVHCYLCVTAIQCSLLAMCNSYTDIAHC